MGVVSIKCELCPDEDTNKCKSNGFRKGDSEYG